MEKKKILALCDHALSTSGVGTQSRHLFYGLIRTGEWTIRQFGAALKHSDYTTAVPHEDLIIKPIDGFGDRDLIRIMHCDPLDQEGANLFAVADKLKITENIFFSRERLDFDKMNVLYNISDYCINISYAEGFGLTTLEAMMSGKPIIAAKTGGLTRQVVDHRDGTENGVALDIDFQSLVGSQGVPYIYEDYVSCDKPSDAMMKLYEMSSEERQELTDKVLSYVNSEFKLQDTIDKWHNSLTDLNKNWKSNYKRWEVISI